MTNIIKARSYMERRMWVEELCQERSECMCMVPTLVGDSWRYTWHFKSVDYSKYKGKERVYRWSKDMSNSSVVLNKERFTAKGNTGTHKLVCMKFNSESRMALGICPGNACHLICDRNVKDKWNLVASYGSNFRIDSCSMQSGWSLK